VNASLELLDGLRQHPLVATVRDIAHAQSVFVLLVGGAVRDVLLGHALHDFDFAVQGDAVRLGRAVANVLKGDFYVMDVERGTVRVLAQDIVLDFAVCRGATWREDLLGRDFTLNAIGLELATGVVIDETGGLPDIQARTLRATTAHAIADDPVRALRLVRMAFQFGFVIEPHTLNQARTLGPTILNSSAERLRDAFFDILSLPAPQHMTQALQLLDEIGLLTHLVPEIGPMRTQAQSAPHRFNVLQHTWHVMARLPISEFGFSIDASNAQHVHQELRNRIDGRSRLALLRFAGLLHDCAKPDTVSIDHDGRLHYYGHEKVGADMAAARARAYKLSGDEVHLIRVIVANHMRPNQMARMPNPPTARTLYRFFRDVGDAAPLLALFAIADCWGKRGNETQPHDCETSATIAALLIAQYYAHYEKSVTPDPLITGRDLLAMGMQPGPHVGVALEMAREAQMAGEINTRDQALALVQARLTAQERRED
jgi:poly(A) polymerase/tRNA nucleotidyltransferase (CCA-adding enzyme)